MRILIVGGNSPLGLGCYKLLNEEANCEVFLLSRSSKHIAATIPSINILQADFLNQLQMYQLFESIKATHLIQLAWENTTGTYWHDEANWKWHDATLENYKSFLKFGGKRWLNVGSCSEYAWPSVKTDNLNEKVVDKIFLQSHPGYIDEYSSLLQPNTIYGKARLLTSESLNSLSEQFNSSIIIARLFFPYGITQHKDRLVPLTIRKLLNKEIFIPSSINVFRDLVFNSDLVLGLCTLLLSEMHGMVNLSSGSPTLLADVVKKISQLLNREEYLDLTQIQQPINSFNPELLIGKNERVKKIWEPKTDLTVGLENILDEFFQ